MSHPEFYILKETGQVWEYTEKLAKVAGTRGLVPYDPTEKVVPVPTVAKKEVETPLIPVRNMIKNELIVYARKQFKVKLDARKNRSDLVKEVLALIEEAK